MTIQKVVPPRIHDLGGVRVTRVLPYRECRSVGPFVFLDHIGPLQLPAGKGIDVLPHPHIGLATVTYLFRGNLFHQDSLGNAQVIAPGEINWMTAGKGIVHSERSPQADRQTGVELEGMQVWVALPAHKEEVEPSFLHYAANELPEWNYGGARFKVLVGSFLGQSSPVAALSPTLYVECQMGAGVSLKLPPNALETALYVALGEVKVGQSSVPQNHLAVLSTNEACDVIAEKPTRAFLLGGEGVGPRSMWWNFVSSTPERIERAKQDWEEKKFPKIPTETE